MTTSTTAQHEADTWNQGHQVGAHVSYWPVLREGPGRYGKIRSEAWVLSSGHAVVMVTGASGAIALTHVKALPDHIAEALDQGLTPNQVQTDEWGGLPYFAETGDVSR